MSLLLESIKVTNKRLVNISYHNARLNASRRAIYSATEDWNLASIIKTPDSISDATYKCRVEYGRDIELIEFIPYQQKVVKTLFLVQANEINYSHKYTDRGILNELKSLLDDPKNSDILIVKDGLITDTSYANIAFFNGISWVTPDSPLLPGTKRRFYLDNQIICEEKIKTVDLNRFSHARLINAMVDLNESADIPIENIIRFF